MCNVYTFYIFLAKRKCSVSFWQCKTAFVVADFGGMR